jgi:hypothetical protein
MVSRCRFGLFDETLRIIGQSANGAVMRVQTFEARHLHFESMELLLEVSAVRSREAVPDTERDVFGSAGRLEEFPDLCPANSSPLCDVSDRLSAQSLHSSMA